MEQKDETLEEKAKGCSEDVCYNETDRAFQRILITV